MRPLSIKNTVIQSFGCHLLYHPKYSPDLNPLEHCWHTIKSRLIPLMYQRTDLQLLVGNTIMNIYHSFQKVLYLHLKAAYLQHLRIKITPILKIDIIRVSFALFYLVNFLDTYD
jgi:transposase